ncbi:hypothetical protein FZEAL_3484 [Fusarium zealandicum]|uniref:FAS1 domain-containing protein n=1 Tax=Fusarium zealandicum TaxID=1053134 RepID=A0A8H4XMX7_9HYPO|nr:hypothetical protein FZEAL_3484 [Fusarium zealandicum]
MKSIVALTLATATSAIVLPESFDGFNHFKDEIKHIPSHISSTLNKAVEHLSSEISDAITEDDILGSLSGSEYNIDLDGHDSSEYTIYELISKSNYTEEFFKLVQDHKEVGHLLNDTNANLTLFAPIDKAFEHIPKDPEHKPSDGFVENVLNYHIGVGEYPAGRILFTHTLPTAFKESWLGDEPQRLRTSVGLSGVRVNVYSKVVAVNIKAKNGYIHAVNKILIPPPMIGRVISLFPAQFSTLLLAYEKTEFVKYVHNVKMIGSTVFAPSNNAWQRLGPRANAFLFNTDTGKKYLKALLKYQIVPNTTVYSDAIYYGDEKDENTRSKNLLETTGDFHIELPTLLEKSVGVDIHTWKGWTTMVVNGAAVVGFQDGIGKNGVVQVVRNVPIPPCKKGGSSTYVDGEIEVEDLKERLDQYVEEDEDDQDWTGEL